MQRSRMFILAGLFAAVLCGAGLAPVSENDHAMAAVSTRLSDAEADCIVGGQMGCLDQAKGAFDQCVRDNVVVGDPGTSVEVLDCLGTGAWTGILCFFDWVWGLFF